MFKALGFTNFFFLYITEGAGHHSMPRLHTVKVGKDSIAIMLQCTMTIMRDLKRKQSINSQPQVQDGEGSSESYMTGKSG